jgi:hypothetical protein
VVHIEYEAAHAHAAYLSIGGDLFLVANRHIVSTSSKFVTIKIAYMTKFVISHSTLHCEVYYVTGDIIFLKPVTKTGVYSSPLVTPLKVRLCSSTYGMANLELLGCKICLKPTTSDCCDLSTIEYKINTVDGDCGRPVIWFD